MSPIIIIANQGVSGKTIFNEINKLWPSENNLFSKMVKKIGIDSVSGKNVKSYYQNYWDQELFEAVPLFGISAVTVFTLNYFDVVDFPNFINFGYYYGAIGGYFLVRGWYDYMKFKSGHGKVATAVIDDLEHYLTSNIAAILRRGISMDSDEHHVTIHPIIIVSEK
jgi:hypothetical protein